MTDLRGRRVAVIGLAASGLAAVRALGELGAKVVVTERRPADEMAEAVATAESDGAEVHAGGHDPSHLEDAELVVVSPGVPEGADILRVATDRGLPIWSELELGARLVRCAYVGVTGTNGKTTTTEMVAAAMRETGLDAIACGNMGYPFSLAALEGHDALAVEASSFQLRFHETFAPRVSALLNLAQDHMDWHGSFEAYRDAKRRIHVNQHGDDVHVGNREDPAAAEVSSEAPCRVAWFTLGEPDEGQVGYSGDELVSRLRSDAASLGVVTASAPSIRADAAAAAAVALSFGVDADAAGRALRRFPPLPHHGETVAEVDGVRFVDDSKATNPHAAVATLRGFPGAVLICGGDSKGIDLSPLRAAIPGLTAAVVLGKAADELERLFEGHLPVHRSGSIEEAVRIAHRLSAPGGSVVLAPACASWDMFADYRERGDRFTAAARGIASATERVHGERR
ncbi:MAG: UDP-N-acetylmuramoyl-L-alanine--D-glutamate ligase [Actinomycetota bacterium]|nr:UDP-N-acetylmuramoyl-L-alanine--D-glutamate ligase [Actinomycetota bacterium]